MTHKTPKCSKMLQKDREGSRIYQNIPEFYRDSRIFHNDLECF